MRNLLRKIPSINFALLCLILFFMRLPPVYLLPIGGSFFTSHSIARYLSLFILISSVLILFIKNKTLEIDKKLIILILFYFLTQSFSVVRSVNIPEYLLVYKNIIFGIVIFFVSLLVVNAKNAKTLISLLLITGVVNLFLETLIYFSPNFIYDYLQPFFDQKYWTYFAYQFQRGRFFGDILDEILVPLIFYFFTLQKKTVNKVLLLLYLSAISFFALLSNWRFKIVILVFSFSASLFFYFRKFKRYFIPSLFITAIFLFVAYNVSLKIVGFNTLDRLLLTNKKDIKSFTSRFAYWDESVKMALYSPLLGVGLGNYYDYLPEEVKLTDIQFMQIYSNTFYIKYDPHNIFFSVLANTGFLGLASYVLIICYFIQCDISSVRKSNPLLTSIVIVFWSLFAFAVLNPAMEFSYQFMFWFLRGTIYKMDSL